ncbi:MAG: hypothetical protein ACRDFX_10860, partial [Chloroflexota bacterium]
LVTYESRPEFLYVTLNRSNIHACTSSHATGSQGMDTSACLGGAAGRYAVLLDLSSPSARTSAGPRQTQKAQASGRTPRGAWRQVSRPLATFGGSMNRAVHGVG